MYEDRKTVVYTYAREVWLADPNRPKKKIRSADQIGKIVLHKKTGGLVRLVDLPEEHMEIYLPRVAQMIRQAHSTQFYPDNIDYIPHCR